MARASFRQDSGSTATARSDWTSLTLTRNSSVLQYTFGKYPAFIHKGKGDVAEQNILPVILGHGDKILVFEQGEIRRTGSQRVGQSVPIDQCITLLKEGTRDPKGLVLVVERISRRRGQKKVS